MRINKSLIAYLPTTGAGSGSVTSVGFSATVPTGLSASISGSPITTAGTIALSLSFAAGYAIPTTIKQSNWDDAYTWVAAFPTQTGNSGKYLTTNGSALSWSTIAGSSITGAALTETDDTNVTMTLGGTPATALLRSVSMTLGWAGQLAVSRGGTGASTLSGVLIGNATAPVTGVTGIGGQILRANPSTGVYEFWTPTYMQSPFTATAGQIIYSNSAGAPLALNPNSTANNMYLRSVSSGTPAWATIQGGDIVGAGISRTNDTNVQITLGGATTDGLLRAVTLTMGWSGQLAVGRGGTGVATITGVVIGNGTSNMTAITGTAGQLLRRNTLDTAYEFWTPTYMHNPFTTGGDLVVSNSAGAPLRLPPNVTTTRKYLSQIGDGTSVTSTTWETVAGGGGLSGSGTANTIAKWTGTSTLNNSGLTDDGSNLIYGSSGFYYDNVNKRLGIGVASPSQALDVSANFGIAKITSAVGTNATFFQFVNTGGNFFIGSEGSTGATFGATPYASVIRTPDTVPLEVFQGAWKAVELLTTGQFKWNDYTSSTSFTGTAAGYLAFTSTGSIITVAAPSSSVPVYRMDFSLSMPQTWNNMPSALSFFNGSTAFITAAELTNFTQVRLLINKLGTAGASGSIVILRYSATYTQNVNLWSAIGTSSVQLSVNATNSFLETAWIDLVAGAKADVFIALMGSGGDGAADPIFGMIAAEFR